MTRRQIVLLVASIAVSGIFLWLALRGVPLAEVFASIQRADFAWIALSFAFATGALFFRGIRWRRLLDDKIPTRPAFYIFSITMLLNQLPLRAGELARILLATRQSIALATAAASVLLERLIDTALVVMALSFALARLPTIPAFAAQAATLFGIGALGGLITLVVFARSPQLMTRIIDWIETRVPALWRIIARLDPRQLAADLSVGLHGLASARGLLNLIVWTLVGWFCSFATYYCLQRALNIQGVDLVLGTLLGVTLATFTVAIPVSVASVGTFEAAVVATGDLIGMLPIEAAALGFLVHGMTVFSYAVWGTIGLIALGVSLGDISQKTTDEP
ncbi:MAG: lysylphosphatidylglycerol synthase transmembrane domain-containing protein [Chloroflexota bacterium]|nr:lysylphosphatidylglycerol synthase transmembrane domain-containing protein [Chloroflexota bacterium]